MKTIGIMDLVERKIRIYNPKEFFKSFQKRQDRIKEALKDIKGLGNIGVYLIKGNKYRLLWKQ